MGHNRWEAEKPICETLGTHGVFEIKTLIKVLKVAFKFTNKTV